MRLKWEGLVKSGVTEGGRAVIGGLFMVGLAIIGFKLVGGVVLCLLASLLAG